MAGAVIGSKLYVAGGNPGPVASLYDYDMATSAWSNLPDMPTSRKLAAGGAMGANLYVVGGYDGTTKLTTLECYNPSTSTWGTLNPMSTARSHVAAAVIGSKMYAIGGHAETSSGQQFLTGATEVYQVATSTWTTLAPMPTARMALAAVAIGDNIHAVGGSLDAVGVATLEVYDTTTSSWSSLGTMPTARWHLAASAIASRMYTSSEVRTQQAPPTCSTSTLPPLPHGPRGRRCSRLGGS